MNATHQFTYPDAHFISAAEGWLALGNPTEANSELARITPGLRTHPEVLLLRWQILAKSHEWQPCLMIARSVTESAPADPRGWLALAQTFYLRGEVAKAYQIVVSKTDAFPRSWPLLYDAARYACLLGKRRQTERYLRLAISAGDKKAIKRQALKDPDLEQFWEEKS